MNFARSAHLSFVMMLAFMITHEVDAAVRQEWRLLFVLRDLPSHEAGVLFTWLHVPLVSGILLLAFHSNPHIQHFTRLALNAFAVVHAVLHAHLVNHPLYQFQGVESHGLIAGAALCGLCGMIIQCLCHNAISSKSS